MTPAASRPTVRPHLLQVRLSDTERERLFESARRESRTISELVRGALRAHLGNVPDEAQS